MTPLLSANFIPPQAMTILRNGPCYPLWRLVATTENCLAVNALSLLVISICVGCIVRKLCFWRESFEVVPPDADMLPPPPKRFAPYLAALSVLVVPQFLRDLTVLTPFYFSFVPSMLSAAVLSSLNSVPKEKAGEEFDDSDDRRLVGPRLVAAGALATLGVWENTIGLLLFPALLAVACAPFVCRGRSLRFVMGMWFAGFASVSLAMSLCFTDNALVLLLPREQPFTGFIVFLAIGMTPLAFVWRYGENLHTVGWWMGILLLLAVVDALTVRFPGQSASERFVRTVLADLGERKMVLGDGVFDAMIDEYLPAGVRRIRVSTPEEKEYLVSLANADPVITNRVLVVRFYYGLGEFEEAIPETGLKYRKPQQTAPSATSVSNMQARVLLEAQPLLESLHAMGEGHENIPESMLEGETRKAQENIRRAWRKGFRGTKLSNTLLMIDLSRENRETLEADAINALVVDREDPAANSILGQLRMEDGKLEEAERYLRKGVKGGGVLAMSRLSMLLVNTGRAAEAEEWARKVVKRVPADWNARQPLAAALIENGKLDAAELELRIVEELATTSDQMKQAESFILGARRRIAELRTNRSDTSKEKF